ncbi:hypothetical protein [Nocardia sp. NPDC059239]|uniref:hypothetical protein n=1 Tax=unclassified Nocardia TaxID=2637762 RepID=UPI0036C6FD00
MNNNDFRAAALGITGGVIATFATITFLDNDMDTRILDAIGRWRMTPRERDEYDRIRRGQAETYAAEARKTEEEQAEIRAKFRPGLLSLQGKFAVQMPLSELSIRDLISEIRYAKTRKREEIADGDGTYVFGEAEVWGPQVDALRSEFQSRHIEDMSLLDRTRYNAAYKYVSSHRDEWPPVPARRTTTAGMAQTSAAGEPSTSYPSYPDFSGPAALADATTEE